MQNSRKAVLYACLCCLELTRNPAQFRARIITKIAVLVNGILQMALYNSKNFNGMRHRLEERYILHEITKKIFHIAHAAHRTHDRAKFIQFKNGSH